MYYRRENIWSWWEWTLMACKISINSKPLSNNAILYGKRATISKYKRWYKKSVVRAKNRSFTTIFNIWDVWQQKLGFIRASIYISKITKKPSKLALMKIKLHLRPILSKRNQKMIYFIRTLTSKFLILKGPLKNKAKNKIKRTYGY